MAFFNWNLFSTPVPTFYTYVIQPSLTPITPVTFGVVNQQLPTLQINNGIGFVQENINTLNNNLSLTAVKNDVKQLPILVNNVNSGVPMTLQLNNGVSAVQESVNISNNLSPTSVKSEVHESQLDGLKEQSVNTNRSIKKEPDRLTEGLKNELELPTLEFKNEVKILSETEENPPATAIKKEPSDGENSGDGSWSCTVKQEQDHNEVKETGFETLNSSSKSWIKVEDEDNKKNFAEVCIKQEESMVEEENYTNLEDVEKEIKSEQTDEDTDTEDEFQGKKSKKRGRKPSKRSKSYNCDHCSYTTNWKGNLTKHVVSRHTALDEIKWLECDLCDYKGKTKDYLKCHMLHVHNVSVKWFNCPHCSFKAKLKSQLERHMILNHTDVEQIQWFSCDLCPYKAKFKINLKQHVLSKHTKPSEIKWFQCDRCNFKAKRKRNLKFHQLNKHTDADKIKWYQCEFCLSKFKRKSAMKLHLATVHAREEKTKKVKLTTKEIPVFIENKLCWKRIVEVNDVEIADCSYKCSQCSFNTTDRENFKKHVMKEHVVTELKQVNNRIVKRTYKTKDVVVMVDDVPCVKKVVEHPLSLNADLLLFRK